jgi:hypothetical protein
MTSMLASEDLGRADAGQPTIRRADAWPSVKAHTREA